MKATIVNFVAESGGDYYQALYLDGKLVMEGDEYHDNIGSKVEGYLEGLKASGTEIEEVYGRHSEKWGDLNYEIEDEGMSWGSGIPENFYDIDLTKQTTED